MTGVYIDPGDEYDQYDLERLERAAHDEWEPPQPREIPLAKRQFGRSSGPWYGDAPGDGVWPIPDERKAA